MTTDSVETDACGPWLPSDSQLAMILDPTPNVQFSLQWPVPLDTHALREALQDLIQRHDILRTTYLTDSAGRIWARTHGTAELALRCVDLRGLSEELAHRSVDEVLAENAAQEFDLAVGPLLRATAMLVDEPRTFLFFAAHHSILDGASQAIVRSELSALYRARCTGVRPSLQPLTTQYRQFARQQRDWLDDAASAIHVDYWQRKMADCEQLFALPYDDSVECEAAVSSPAVTGVMDGHAYQSLRARSLRQRTPMFNIVAAAFLLRLGQWSGRPDAAAWVTHLGRSRPEHLRMIGCFANYWLLRVDLSGNPCFREATARVVTAVRETLPHRDVTVQRLLPVLQKARGERRRFPSIVFNYINMQGPGEPPAARHPWRSATVTRSGDLGASSALALTIQLVDDERSVSWAIHYAKRLFTTQTISGFSAEFASVLRAAGQSAD